MSRDDAKVEYKEPVIPEVTYDRAKERIDRLLTFIIASDCDEDKAWARNEITKFHNAFFLPCLPRQIEAEFDDNIFTNSRRYR